MTDKCDWCGTLISRDESNRTNGIRAGNGFLKHGRLYCSNKCKTQGEEQFNKSNSKSSNQNEDYDEGPSLADIEREKKKKNDIFDF